MLQWHVTSPSGVIAAPVSCVGARLCSVPTPVKQCLCMGQPTTFTVGVWLCWCWFVQVNACCGFATSKYHRRLWDKWIGCTASCPLACWSCKAPGSRTLFKGCWQEWALRLNIVLHEADSADVPRMTLFPTAIDWHSCTALQRVCSHTVLIGNLSTSILFSALIAILALACLTLHLLVEAVPHPGLLWD